MSFPKLTRARAALAPAASLALVALAVAAPALLPPSKASAIARADDGAAARLPWNPADDAKPGDWAFYQVRDPDKPEERLPGERYLVSTADDASITIVDSKNEQYRFLKGEKGLSARAWVDGFFGELRRGKVGEVQSLTAVPGPCDLDGKRYDATRIEVVLVMPLSQDSKDVMRSTLRMWIAKGVHASGLVRAEAEVSLGAEVHRGIFELEAHGTKDDKMPSRNPSDQAHAATPTAAPAAATPTAVPPPK